MPYLRNLKSSRVDVVNDVYKDNSLKSHVRGLRGNGGKIYKVDKNTKLPRDWKAFLRNDENKTLLVSFLANEITSQTQQDNKLIYRSGKYEL